MNIIKSKQFWIGVGVGVFVMPAVMTKVPALGNLRAKIPA